VVVAGVEDVERPLCDDPSNVAIGHWKPPRRGRRTRRRNRRSTGARAYAILGCVAF
jgi:hypothetical protein